MCSGVVPQHPPMIFTPARSRRRAYWAIYSGEHKINVAALHARRNARVGHGAQRFGANAAPAASMTSSMVLGPTEQFTPNTSAGQASISRAKLPPMRRRKGGQNRPPPLAPRSPDPRPAASRAAKMASRSSFRSPKVSSTSRSAPACDQHLGLLAKNGARFGKRSGPERLQVHAQRTHRARYKRPAARRFARQPDAGRVDRPRAFPPARTRPAARDSPHRCWFPESRLPPRHSRDELAAPDRETKGSVHRSSG